MTVVFSLLGVTLKAVSMVPSSSLSSSLFGPTSLSACLEDPPTNPGEDTPKRTSGNILISKLKKWWHGLSYEMLLSRVPDYQISQIIGQSRRLEISSAQSCEYKKNTNFDSRESGKFFIDKDLYFLIFCAETISRRVDWPIVSWENEFKKNQGPFNDDVIIKGDHYFR